MSIIATVTFILSFVNARQLLASDYLACTYSLPYFKGVENCIYDETPMLFNSNHHVVKSMITRSGCTLNAYQKANNMGGLGIYGGFSSKLSPDFSINSYNVSCMQPLWDKNIACVWNDKDFFGQVSCFGKPIVQKPDPLWEKQLSSIFVADGYKLVAKVDDQPDGAWVCRGDTFDLGKELDNKISSFKIVEDIEETVADPSDESAAAPKTSPASVPVPKKATTADTGARIVGTATKEAPKTDPAAQKAPKTDPAVNGAHVADPPANGEPKLHVVQTSKAPHATAAAKVKDVKKPKDQAGPPNVAKPKQDTKKDDGSDAGSDSSDPPKGEFAISAP